MSPTLDRDILYSSFSCLTSKLATALPLLKSSVIFWSYFASAQNFLFASLPTTSRSTQTLIFSMMPAWNGMVVEQMREEAVWL